MVAVAAAEDIRVVVELEVQVVAAAAVNMAVHPDPAILVVAEEELVNFWVPEVTVDQELLLYRMQVQHKKEPVELLLHTHLVQQHIGFIHLQVTERLHLNK
jgi:hypothetical protein